MPNQYTAKRLVIIPVGPSIAYVPLTHGVYALIDSEDAPLVQLWDWSAHWAKNTRSYYAIRSIILPSGKRITESMHQRVYPNVPLGYRTDHRNINTLDNRKSNLRAATRDQQSQNRRRLSSSTSGFKGVSPHSQMPGRWVAEIKVNKKRIYLGFFSDPQKAYAAYCSAATKYHGEFARTE